MPSLARDPLNIIHTDVLAPAVGKNLYGIYYERTMDPTGERAHWSRVIGVSAAIDIEWDVAGVVDAPKVEMDLYGLGFQSRYYGHGQFGFYGATGLSIIGGEGVGSDGDVQREYSFWGADLALISLGYQHVFFGHLAIDIIGAFHQWFGYLKGRGGGGEGYAGNYAVTLAGGVGIGF